MHKIDQDHGGTRIWKLYDRGQSHCTGPNAGGGELLNDDCGLTGCGVLGEILTGENALRSPPTDWKFT